MHIIWIPMRCPSNIVRGIGDKAMERDKSAVRRRLSRPSWLGTEDYVWFDTCIEFGPNSTYALVPRLQDSVRYVSTGYGPEAVSH